MTQTTGYQTTIAESWRIQCRVLSALVRREFIASYGRRGLGFSMVFMEPLFIMGCVMVIASMTRFHMQSTGFPVVPFVVTGWGVLWVCRYPIMHMVGVVLASASFLYHRNITVMDILISRAVVNVFGCVFSFIAIFFLYQFCFATFYPYDPLYLILSVFLLIWYTLGLCIFSGVISAYYAIGSRLPILIAVLHIGLSGFFFMVDWVPIQFRSAVLMIPLINVTEMMRYGVFGNLVPCYFSVVYPFSFNLAMTFLTFFWCQRLMHSRTVHGIAG